MGQSLHKINNNDKKIKLLLENNVGDVVILLKKTDIKEGDLESISDNDRITVISHWLKLYSPVFEKMLSINMTENQSKVIDMTNHNPKLIREFINYIYYDSYQNINLEDYACNEWFEMLSLVNMYEMTQFYNNIHIEILKRLTSANVIIFLNECDKYPEITAIIKEKCFYFLFNVIKDEKTHNLLRFYHNLAYSNSEDFTELKERCLNFIRDNLNGIHISNDCCKKGDFIVMADYCCYHSNYKTAPQFSDASCSYYTNNNMEIPYNASKRFCCLHKYEITTQNAYTNLKIKETVPENIQNDILNILDNKPST